MAARHLHYQSAIRIMVFFIAGIFLSACIISPSSATPPPPEYRAAFILPHPDNINNSIQNFLFLTDEPVPAFPNLSSYYAHQNILYRNTSEHVVSEVWYFTDDNEFSTQWTLLKNYLRSHGTISNTTLAVSEQSENFSNDPNRAGSSVRLIPVLKYESNETSGYFIILPEDYYIAYYGIPGPDNLEDHSSLLKMLIVSAVPSDYKFADPSSFTKVSFSPWQSVSPGLIVFLLIGIVVAGLIIYARRKG